MEHFLYMQIFLSLGLCLFAIRWGVMIKWNVVMSRIDRFYKSIAR